MERFTSDFKSTVYHSPTTLTAKQALPAICVILKDYSYKEFLGTECMRKITKFSLLYLLVVKYKKNEIRSTHGRITVNRINRLEDQKIELEKVFGRNKEICPFIKVVRVGTFRCTYK